MKKPLSFGMTMLASALGVVIVSIIAGVLMFAMMMLMVASVAKMDSSELVAVRPGTVLKVDLGHISGDRTESGLTMSLGGGKSVGLVDAVSAIRHAATDNRVNALYLTDNGLSELSWGSLTELRDAIEEFRGEKPVVAYATTWSQGGYYVASAASRICLHPSGMVDFRGLGGEVMYYKDLLDKLGVEMQLIRPESCAYKSAGEVYTLNHMSAANREQIRAYISSIWNTATEAIAASRNLEVSQLNAIADNLSGYLAEDAQRSGLVDALCFEEDVRSLQLKGKHDGKQLLPLEDYAKNYGLSSDNKQAKNKIAVIYAEGNVVDGSARGMDRGVYGDDIVKALRQAMNDDRVKAIVLRVNSPGGQATASESMTHAVMQAREKKPVVVSMGDLAASAGYEMSCMADVIVAQPTTITGSIGVFGTLPNVGKLMNQKLGLHTDTVSTNRNANGLTIFRPLSPTAMAMMERNVEDFYKLFVFRVAEGRKMSEEAVHQIARGRVWTGVDAKRIGLVDTLGGIDLALRIAAERAGIKDYAVKAYPQEKDVWTQLQELFGDGTDNDLNLMAKGWLAYRWKSTSKASKMSSKLEQDLLFVANSEGLQARIPFVVFPE